MLGTDKKGFSLIEAMISLGLFFVVITGSLVLMFRYLDTTNKSQEISQARHIAEESLEAFRSVGYEDWASVNDGDYGLDDSGGSWILVGTPDTVDGRYERTITVSSVNRDEDCLIVETGGETDPDTKTVSVVVEWGEVGYEQTVSLNRNFVSWWAPTMCTAFEIFQYVFHGNANINFNNSTGTVNGDINAGGSFDLGSFVINGDSTEHSEKNIPYVDYDEYEADADTVIEGNFTFEEGQTYNGIYFITGNATIESDVTINGTVVALSGITIGGADGVVVNATAPYPAFISDNNVSGNNAENCVINGLIFADGNITFNSSDNLTFNGSLLAGGNVEIKNSSNITVNYDEDLLDEPPPYFY